MFSTGEGPFRDGHAQAARFGSQAERPRAPLGVNGGFCMKTLHMIGMIIVAAVFDDVERATRWCAVRRRMPPSAWTFRTTHLGLGRRCSGAFSAKHSPLHNHAIGGCPIRVIQPLPRHGKGAAPSWYLWTVFRAWKTSFPRAVDDRTL